MFELTFRCLKTKRATHDNGACSTACPSIRQHLNLDQRCMTVSVGKRLDCWLPHTAIGVQLGGEACPIQQKRQCSSDILQVTGLQRRAVPQGRAIAPSIVCESSGNKLITSKEN
eukprot:1090211-Pleurochrysis_carterae.AAC.2